MTYKIRPIRFSWYEWLVRVRTNRKFILDSMRKHRDPARCAMELCAAFDKHTDAWLSGLDDELKKDVVQLIQAEAFMLAELMDPGYKQRLDGPRPPDPDSEEGMEFRERWRDMLPLALAAARIGLHGAAETLEDLRLLEARAEAKRFLP